MATYLDFEQPIKKIEDEIVLAKTKADEYAVKILEEKLAKEVEKTYSNLTDYQKLINLASPDEKIWDRSIRALLKEPIELHGDRVSYLVMHPGSHRGSGEAQGIKRITDGLKIVIHQIEDVKILLETTAGQGTSIGYKFEHLADIIDKTGYKDRLGICIDTCHIFAAGYDFRTKEAYNSFINELENRIGLDYIFLFHINDSKKELGSKVDRHMHIGKGMIGIKGFKYFLKDKRFKNHSFIIETPKEKDENGKDYDIINLNTLREIIKEEKNDNL